MRFLKKLAASVALIAQLVIAGNAIAQAMPATIFNPTSVASGWSYDPSTQGMRDLRELLPIEGCNAPGGLTRITDRDESDSAPFWCGTPPHCLAENTNGADACVFVPYCRREPRYNPSGISGGNGCRDPEDLRCVSSGAPPEGGKCLKTCWDSSRILFSEACPPQCSTDSKGNTTCIYDSPPSLPPRTPPGYVPAPTPTPKPTPTPTPTPTKLSCPAGSGSFEACVFSWPTTAHAGFTSVGSINGTPGTLAATCNDGTWTGVVVSCTPTIPKKSCPSGSVNFEACVFSWPTTAHAGFTSVSSTNGTPGTLSATCNDGTWTGIVSTCTPPPTVCPDGSVVPAGTGCPTPVQYCPDGITVMPKNGVCPQPTKICPPGVVVPLSQPCPTTPDLTKTCPDGSVILATDACTPPPPPPPTKTCPDGSVIPASAACWTPPPASASKTCPDGSVIPASAACVPPPPVNTACVPINIGCGSITVADAEAKAAAAGATCFTIIAVSGHDFFPASCVQYPENPQPTCYEASYVSAGACVGG